MAFRPACRADYLDPSAQWLRFRRDRDGKLVAYLADGKIVFVDRRSRFQPREPGHYLAAAVYVADRAAFAIVVRAHRNLNFSREETFGPTGNGRSILFSFRKRRRKILPFVCDPGSERLELFGFDTLQAKYASGREEYYEFRHGEWRLLNYSGPQKMSDAAFQEAQRKVNDFQNAKPYAYSPSPCNIWSEAVQAGIVGQAEFEEAARRFGRLWHYSGD